MVAQIPKQIKNFSLKKFKKKKCHMSSVKPLKALDFTAAVKSKQGRLNPGFVSTL